MGKRRPDRRIERTKRQLHAALLALIERRSYPRITVHDITAHANVGRSTFYSHFKSKEDLLFRAFERRLKSLATQPPAHGQSRAAGFQFSLPLIRHIGEQRRFAQAMLAGEGSALIRRK